jgi:hypothetical protein
MQLSQLGQTSPTAGQPERFSKLTWLEFVQHVLELTVRAYQAMLRARIAQPDWEENTFTIRLANEYLRPIAFDDEYSIRVEVRSKVHTKQMGEGRQATIEAKEMDLSMYGVWERDYLRKRFVWEAKRVGDKRVNGKFRILNSEYVHEAIYRFIRGEYADGLSDAGILGYVLAGSVANIANDINQSMGRIRKNPPLRKSNHLQMASPVDNFEDVYRSHHTRTNNSKICLHHLFLTFEFA